MEDDESSRPPVAREGRALAAAPGRVGRDGADRFEGPEGIVEADGVDLVSGAAGVEREVPEDCPGLTGRPFGPVGTPPFGTLVVEAEEPVDVPRGGAAAGAAAVEEEAGARFEGFAGIVVFAAALFAGASAGAGELAGVGEFDRRGWEGARDDGADGALNQCFLRLKRTAWYLYVSKTGSVCCSVFRNNR